MMNDDSHSRHLSYRASFLSAIVIFISSLFCQWLNWFIYEKEGYAWGFALITPLVLCMMYHFVQLDAGRNGNFSRIFFFVFSAALPLAASAALALVMKRNYPELGIFGSDRGYSGSAEEKIALYAGRFVLTSAYLAVFAVIDVPLLRYADKKEKKK